MSILVCFFMANITILEAESVYVSGESAILMDQETGRVLYEKNADNKTLIASITKIMTAIVAIESSETDKEVTITKNAVGTEGSSIYLKEGEKFTVKELLYGLMLRSGNDAAVAISEEVGGSTEGFVHLMNEKAMWIGMNNTHFDNPHGLDSETHYSTAYDMALLTKYAMENNLYQTISGTTSFKANSREYSWKNKNKLLTAFYEYCTGGKTGYTKAAGRTLVTTAEKNGQTLIAVTLNAPNDWQDHIRMFEWGFEHFNKEQIQSSGLFTYYDKEKNEQREGQIVTSEYYPLRDTEKDKIMSKTLLPIDSDGIGKKLFYLDEEIIAESIIYPVEEKEEKKSFINHVTRLFLDIIGGSYD
jgi:serine-type D-Ala-D-Ala carboxypeptidase (penicillin-binding protein 5/6)